MSMQFRASRGGPPAADIKEAWNQLQASLVQCELEGDGEEEESWVGEWGQLGAVLGCVDRCVDVECWR